MEKFLGVSRKGGFFWGFVLFISLLSKSSTPSWLFLGGGVTANLDFLYALGCSRGFVVWVYILLVLKGNFSALRFISTRCQARSEITPFKLMATDTDFPVRGNL